jgi:DNA-binding transcriptional regulator LsrR (DeoR family)
MWYIHDGGSQMKSDRFLIKAAELYYRDGLSQQEIAQKLHTSRTSISRALIQARNEGYVQIRIQYPEQSNLGLERELEEKYGLTEALIAVPAYDQSSDQEVAFQAVDYTLRVLKKNMVLGMTWGRAMHGFVEQLAQDERLRSLSFRNVKIVPFLGTPGVTQLDSWDATTYSNTLATKVGNLLHCASYNLSAPMYVDGEKEKELIEGIDEISKVLHMAETADMALIGIGSMQKDSSIIKAGIRTEEEYKELIQKGAVGEIVGRIYDKNGQTVDEDLQRKMIGISLDKIAKIPVRVGISYGKDKIEAIKGAIAGGLVNVLVTDVPTAELLLK